MKRLKKIAISIFIILTITGGVGAYLAYRIIKQPNLALGNKKSKIIFIPTGSDFNDVLELLSKDGLLIDPVSFEWLAKQKQYTENVKPGRYRLLARMGNNELINILRSGMQEPVNVAFHSLRTKEELVSRICNKLEADSLELISYLNDRQYMQENFGMDANSALSLFIPNTYEFYWNTSAEDFLKRMAKEYKNFWTEERKAKAKKLGLSQTEVAILASIVQAEQWRHNDEKAIIAGLYLNRLRMGMALQSDPTIIYALGDFSIKRVLNKDKQIDSPYNTYKYLGLPPGPVNLPEISSLDAVLNAEKNNYLYMCAKEDFSGRHNFTRNYDEHMRNADRYRRALNKEKIMR